MDTAPQSQAENESVGRSWRIVTWAGVLGSTYFLLCVTGAARIKFFTEMKATAFDFGLMAGLGAFAIAFQLIGSIISNGIDRRKRVWMTFAIIHRLLFIGVLFGPFLVLDTRGRLWWMILFLFLHDSIAHLASPIWLSWMADLVPSHRMNRLWATRQRFITATNIIVMVIVAFGFDYFERTGEVIRGFVMLGIIGVILGVIDILFFFAVPDLPNVRVERVPVLHTIAQPLRDRQFRGYLIFMAYWHVAVFCGAPFFGPFLIEDLKLSVLTVQLLGIPAALGVVVTSRYWGLLCDTYGFRAVLRLLAFWKAFTPLFFLLVPRAPAIAIPLLTITMFLDGVMNAGVALAYQGVLLKSTPRKNRAMYIAAVNFFSIGIAATITPIITGHFIDDLNQRLNYVWGPYVFNGYSVAFLVGTFLRFGAVPLASRIHDPLNISVRTIVGQMRSLRSYHVARLVYRLNESRNDTERLGIVHRLGMLGNPLAIGELISCLKDNNSVIRNAAADALGDIGLSEAAGPLASVMCEPALGIQSTAARALGKIGGEDSLRALLQNLNTADATLLGQTIDSLAFIGDSASIVPLICLFHKNKNEDIRLKIVQALGTLSETESIEDVYAALQGVTTGR